MSRASAASNASWSAGRDYTINDDTVEVHYRPRLWAFRLCQILTNHDLEPASRPTVLASEPVNRRNDQLISAYAALSPC